MKCHACGAEVEQNAIYCSTCGERVDMPPEPEPSIGQPQEGTISDQPPAAETSPPASADSSQSPADRLTDSLEARKQPDEEERELWKGRYSRRTMIGTWLLCGLITVLVLLVGGLWVRNVIVWCILLVALLLIWGYPALLLLYRRMSIRYRLTSQRFFHEAGILRHVTDRIEVIDMDDISFDQTILQRLVNVGTIHITSSDRSHPVLDICGIENVKEVASMMDDARRHERIRRGLHIEAV